MRHIALVPALLLTASFAFADDAARIDLDRPGVLEQLQQDHPQRYQAVDAVLRASERVPCQSRDLAVLKTRFNVRDLECGVMVLTRYPALRHVSFELDGASYLATVTLKDAQASVQPAREPAQEPNRVH